MYGPLTLCQRMKLPLAGRDLTFCAEAAARPMSQPPAHDVWLSRPHVLAPGREQRYSLTDKCPLP